MQKFNLFMLLMLLLLFSTALKWKKLKDRLMIWVVHTLILTKKSMKCSLILLKSNHIHLLLSLKMLMNTITMVGGNHSIDNCSVLG